MVGQIVSQVDDKATQRASVGRVSAEDYMEHYAHDFYEWVRGELIKMSPTSSKHNAIIRYLSNLLEIYFELKTIGHFEEAPFVMRVESTESRREPDLQIILDDNPGELTDTAMIGPADICIEIISPESSARDRGDKFDEYEKGRVREYWLFDPIREQVYFYRLDDEKKNYTLILAGRDGQYQTPLLPGLVVDVGVFWQKKLPSILSIVDAVKAMLET